MTDIIFSFDTEDFTSNRSADAIYREAEILREEGIKGGFCVVGLLAKQLENWGRSDVLDALKHHIIGCHTYGHSLHPTINEYTDIESFDEAYSELMRQEKLALEYINHATDNVPLYMACPPGNQKTYVAMYAYADLGLPIYADTYCDTADGEGVFCCNIFHTQYTFGLEAFIYNDSDEYMQEVLDNLAKHKRAIVFTHPNSAVFDSTWDIENYCKKNLCEFGQWKEPPRKSEEVTEKFYAAIRKFVKLIKNDKRFNITDYEELANELSKEGERIVKLADIPYIAKCLNEKFYPIKSPVSLSLSDIFHACVNLLKGNGEHICGKVYGFLDTPYAITESITLKADDIIAAAKTIDLSGFLPEKITVGNTDIGPADLIRAATEVLQGKEAVTISPAPQLPELDEFPKLKNCNFKTWIIQSDEFEDNFLSKRLKLQSWTIRFINKE